MSNVPLPEPHHQSAANFNAPDELHQGPKTERTRVPGYTGPREPALEKRVA